jgi:hypothetical protein
MNFKHRNKNKALKAMISRTAFQDVVGTDKITTAEKKNISAAVPSNTQKKNQICIASLKDKII